MTRLEGFVDHFENEGAIIFMADRGFACVSRQLLPTNIHEGDFIVEDDQKHLLAVDYEITELHRREIRRMAENYFD